MKTLINKANQAIRITAPEITIEPAPFNNHQYVVYCISAIDAMYSPIDWTLVEEEYIENRNDGTFTFVNTEEEPEKLTWEDVRRLYLIWREVSNELDACSKNFPKWSSSTKDMFNEVLRRFYKNDSSGI